MHISEGIITGYPAAAYTAAGLALMGLGTWRMKKFAAKFPDKKPLIGMGGALIFFVSLIPLPAFTGTCSHPCGTPLIAILLGPAIGIGLAGIALLLQAAFFAHGGFSTWGANVLTLGLAGCVTGWLTFRGARKLGLPLWLSGGVAGLLGDIMVYAVSGLILAWTLVHAPTPQYTFKGYLISHLCRLSPHPIAHCHRRNGDNRSSLAIYFQAETGGAGRTRSNQPKDHDAARQLSIAAADFLPRGRHARGGYPRLSRNGAASNNSACGSVWPGLETRSRIHRHG